MNMGPTRSLNGILRTPPVSPPLSLPLSHRAPAAAALTSQRPRPRRQPARPLDTGSTTSKVYEF